DRDRYAVEREIGVGFGRELLRARKRLRLRAQGDEDRGVAVGADARVAVGDGRPRARFAAAMRRHDRGCRHSHRAYAFAIDSTTGATSWADSIDHSRSAKCRVQAGPSSGPTRSWNFALSPASSSGTIRDPSASSAWRVNVPRAVVTVTRAGRNCGERRSISGGAVPASLRAIMASAGRAR